MTNESASNTLKYDVDYDTLDAFKREAMAAARGTAAGLLKAGFKEIPESRGESAYLIKGHDMILAFVVEGLGTLNKIAEEVLEVTGESFMAEVHRANFATILNDLMASGAYPLIANGLTSVGDESYFKRDDARNDAIHGWQQACIEVGCAWGGGETQKLRDIVMPGSAVLAGAAVGIIKPLRRWIKGNIRPGDRIFVVQSSGVHANGITLVRDVANMLTHRYSTRLPNGQTFGEALLRARNPLYGTLTQIALDAHIDVHYISNITGHGWRKVMRLEKSFTYVIEKLPEPQPEFAFIQQHSGASDRKMFETFNMGGGVVYFIPPEHGDRFCYLSKRAGFGRPLDVGYVEKGPRRVEMPGDIGAFESEEYQVR